MKSEIIVKLILALLISIWVAVIYVFILLAQISNEVATIAVLEARRDSINVELTEQLNRLEYVKRSEAGYINPRIKAHVDSVYKEQVRFKNEMNWREEK